MPSLLHISVTTGDVFGPGSVSGRDRTPDVRRALELNGGKLDGTPWEIRELPFAVGGGRIFDVVHDGSPVARGWLCFDPAAHGLMWTSGVLKHFSGGVTIEEPKSGPWLLTAQLPDGARLAADKPDLRLDARKLLRETAWAMMGADANGWDAPRGA